MLALADHLGEEKLIAWPSIQRLMDMTSLGRTAVKSALSSLEKAGFLLREKRPNTTDLYGVCVWRFSEEKEEAAEPGAAARPSLATEQKGEATETAAAAPPGPEALGPAARSCTTV